MPKLGSQQVWKLSEFFFNYSALDKNKNWLAIRQLSRGPDTYVFNVYSGVLYTNNRFNFGWSKEQHHASSVEVLTCTCVDIHSVWVELASARAQFSSTVAKRGQCEWPTKEYRRSLTMITSAASYMWGAEIVCHRWNSDVANLCLTSVVVTCTAFITPPSRLYIKNVLTLFEHIFG